MVDAIIRENWECYLKSRGYSESELASAMTYVDSLLNSDFPPIMGRDHLALLLGRTDLFLLKATQGTESFYRSFTIPKKSGGLRQITAPYPSLLECQRWINKNILGRIQLNEAAHGFVKGRSIRTNASSHLGAKMVLKMDLKDFFPSIGFERILMVFHTVGYSDTVSYFLARLCSYKDCLPQGAPTSPALSNIIAMPMDYRLQKLAQQMGLNYTRYADDLTFSGDLVSVPFIRMVRRIVENEGFIVNDLKTHLYRHSSSRKIVTGIVVSGERLALPKEFRQEMRRDLHYIMKYGIESHLKERKIRNINYYEHILGKVNFWLSIEPDNVLARQARAYFIQHREDYYGIHRDEETV